MIGRHVTRWHGWLHVFHLLPLPFLHRLLHLDKQVHSQIHARNSHHHSNPIMPQSQQNFRPVPTVKLLQIMFRNSCRPTTVRTVTVGDADGSMLSKLWPVWSASHHDPLSTTQGSSTSTSAHCNRITRHHLQIGCSNIWSITQVFNKLNLVALRPHPCRRSWASAAAAVEGNSSSLIKIDRSTSLRAHCVYTEST